MQIIFGKASDSVFDQITYLNMLRFRHRVFRERLNWEVQSTDDMEFDIFDTLNPYYMIAQHAGEIIGCWRLLPTTGPYMLKNTFPQLLNGQPAPEHESIWEVSRFAMATPGNSKNEQAIFNHLTLEMFRRSVLFAKQFNIKHFVSVNSMAFEKVMNRSGVISRRFENSSPQRIGKVRTVACWIDINEQLVHSLFDSTAIAA